MMNNLKQCLILFIFISSLTGCSAFQAVKLINSGEVVANNCQESTIPFTLEEHPILINVELNKSQKEYLFIFDTGALTMIRQEVAKELNLQKKLQVNAAGTGGKSKTIDLVLFDNIKVGKMDVRDCAAGVTDFSDIFSPEIAGILGSNFFKHFIVTIDYQKKIITFSLEQENVPMKENSVKIPFKTNIKNGLAPEIICKVEDSIAGKAIIDTGFSGIIALPSNMIQKTNSFKEGKVITAQGKVSGGMFGMAGENYRLRLDELTIGDMKLKNIPSESHVSRDDQLLIGNGLMDKFLITLNYPENEIVLTPNGIPFETDIPSYGLSLEKKDSKTLVSGMWDNSPASRSNIKIGDEIITINSLKAEKLSLLELMVMFSKEDTSTLVIEFLNDKGKQKVTLQKENLLSAL